MLSGDNMTEEEIRQSEEYKQNPDKYIHIETLIDIETLVTKAEFEMLAERFNTRAPQEIITKLVNDYVSEASKQIS
jgi:hypothetical protein